MFTQFKNILFKKMTCYLIPQDKPRPYLVALMYALTSGVRYLYSSVFSVAVLDVEARIVITPQVWSLEHALNNRFNSVNPIYIENGVFRQAVPIYTRGEEKPVSLYLREDNAPVSIHLRSESGFKGVSFRVRVPTDLMSRADEISAFVAQNKLASKTFSVIEYEA